MTDDPFAPQIRTSPASAPFTITYGGPALRAGEMAVKDLAPALLDLGNLFVVCGRTLFPDHKPVTLTVRATSQGSIIVHLGLEAVGLWTQLSAAAAGASITDLASLLRAVAGRSGLLALVKQSGGREVVQVQPSQNPGSDEVLVFFDDGRVVRTTAEAVRLYESEVVGRKIKGVVRPLRTAGIDRMVVHIGGEETVSIDEADVPSFAPTLVASTAPETSEAVLDLDVSTVSFTTDNKWRFDDGTAKFAADVTDPKFLREVGDGEPFAAGDRLRAVVRTTQVDGPTGPQTRRELVEIIEHTTRAHQHRIDNLGDG